MQKQHRSPIEHIMDVHIETRMHYSDFLRTHIIVASYSFCDASGLGQGFMYGLGRRDDTFRALLINSLLDDLKTPLRVFCKGLAVAVQRVAESTSGLTTKGEPYQDYDLLKRLAEATQAKELELIKSTSSKSFMPPPQSKAYMSAKILMQKCRHEVDRYSGSDGLNGDYVVLKYTSPNLLIDNAS